MPVNITIELKNLRFFAYHGWHEEEAILANEFEVALLATFPAKDTIETIEDTIDYTKVYELAKQVFNDREKLLETVAEKIVKRIEKSFPQIQHVQLTITKLNPLLEQFTGTVGITYAKDFK